MTTLPTPKVKTLIETTPTHERWESKTLAWVHLLTDVPMPNGYKPSTKYPGWGWAALTALPTTPTQDTPTPAPLPAFPLSETYEVKDTDGNTSELVRRYVITVDAPVAIAEPETVAPLTEVDTLPEPTPTYAPEPEPFQSYRMHAGYILDKVTGTKTKWETVEDKGKRVAHGDMVLIGDPTTPLCGLVYAVHLRDLCKVWGRAQELTLVCKEEHLEIYPHTPDLMPNQITLNWRAYDPKYEHEIIKLTHP